MIPILILGGGRVGSAIARDLAADGQYEVTVADRSPEVRESLTARYGLHTAALDVGDAAALRTLVEDGELIVGAVPGAIGYGMLETVIRAGRNVVDISFFPGDPFSLDRLAKDQGVTAVVDAGLAPGLPNLVLGHYHPLYDRIDRFVCYVGGLPQRPTGPFKYQTVFSPADVIAGYTRPARMRVGGQVIVKEALSDLEQVDLPGVGTLEAFTSDGLRTLLTTLPVPEMAEKTLRYPGHAERIRLLREVGFFGVAPLDLAGQKVVPLELTTRLLSDAWRPGEGNADRDLTVMRIEIEGVLEGQPATTSVYLYDLYDDKTQTTSMARTTGYTCAAVVRLVASGHYRKSGIQPLELIGEDAKAYEQILSDLAARGVELRVSREEGIA